MNKISFIKNILNKKFIVNNFASFSSKVKNVNKNVDIPKEQIVELKKQTIKQIKKSPEKNIDAVKKIPKESKKAKVTKEPKVQQIELNKEIKVEIEEKTAPKKKVQTKEPKLDKDILKAKSNKQDKQQIVKTEKVDEWKVDIINNPQILGKLPLNIPIFLNNFPKKIPGCPDSYEGYIKSERISKETKAIIETDHRYNCRNYAPVPVVLKEAHGPIVEDIDGFKYLDCLMGYGSVNLGHGNEKIHKEITNQISKLYMTARAFYNDKLHETAKLLCETFGKEKVCFANGGVEAVETALKLARRWAYRVKGIKDNKAKIVFANGNFMGRTITVCGASDELDRNYQFGPYVQDAFHLVPYNDVKSIADLLEKDPDICAVFLEPIQGEAGIIIPDDDYLSNVYDLCKKHNVLFIDDEIQAGLGRSGRLLACEYSLKEKKPDMILLAKSLTNGYYPVSIVLADKNIIDLIGPGEHGSTFSGNPLGMTITSAGIKELLVDQGKLIRNSFDMGSKLCYLLNSLNSPLIKEVRGRGLFIGIEFHKDIQVEPSDIVLMLMERGLITKQTHKYNIRITPAITIGWKEVEAIYHIVKNVLGSISTQLNYFPKEPTKTNFLITVNAKNECDNYLKENHEINYKTKNPKQEAFKLSVMSPLSLISDQPLKGSNEEEAVMFNNFITKH